MKIGNELFNKSDLTNIFIRKRAANNLFKYCQFNNKYYTLEELKNDKSILLSDLSKYDVLKINSTKGNSSYIVDVGKDDPFNFYGDYVHVSSNNSIEDLTDLYKWSKQDKKNYTNNPYENNFKAQRINTVAENLLSTKNQMSLNRDLEFNKKNKLAYFSFDDFLTDDKKIIDYFINSFDILHIYDLAAETVNFTSAMQEVKINENETLLDKINEVIKIMKYGKRGNFLTQIPVTYFTCLSYLGKTQANNSAIYSFKQFYKQLIKYINDTLKEIIGEDLFKDNDGNKLDLWESFKANGYDLDINTNINNFINILANSKYITNAITVIKCASDNVKNNYSKTDYDVFEYRYKLATLPFNESLRQLYYKLSNPSSYGFELNETTFLYENTKFLQMPASIIGDLMWNWTKVANACTGLGVKSISKFIINTSEWLSENKNLQNIANNSLKKVCENLKSNIEYVKDHVEYAHIYDILKNKDFITFPDFELVQKECQKLTQKQFKVLINPINTSKVNNEKLKQEIERDKKIYDKLDFVANTIDCITTVSSSFTNFYNWTYTNGGLASTQEKLSVISNTIVEVTNSILKTIPATDPATASIKAGIMISLTLLQDILFDKTSYNEFVFSDPENPNNSYIWDGGVTISRLFGSINAKDRGIQDAKLIKPVKFIGASNQDYYIYNGRKYNESEMHSLENEIIEDFFENQPGAIIIYSPINKDNPNFSKYRFPNQDRAINFVAENPHLFNYDPYNVNGNTIPAFNTLDEAFWFANNYIKSNRRVKYYVRMPKQVNGFAEDTKLEDSLTTDEIKTAVKKQDQSIINQLLWYTYNDANEGEDKITEKEIIAHLKSKFFDTVQVRSKEVSQLQYLNNKQYDSLNKIHNTYIYKLNVNNSTLYYFSYKDAIKKLMSKDMLNIEYKDVFDGVVSSYEFDDRVFKTEEELNSYIELFVEKHRINKNTIDS